MNFRLDVSPRGIPEGSWLLEHIARMGGMLCYRPQGIEPYLGVAKRGLAWPMAMGHGNGKIQSYPTLDLES